MSVSSAAEWVFYCAGEGKYFLMAGSWRELTILTQTFWFCHCERNEGEQEVPACPNP